MKTIITAAVPEHGCYTCDVSGAPLEYGPVASIVIRCGYGAPYDGDTFELHLSEKAAEVVLPFLRATLLHGGPLAPHRIESLFSVGEREEKRVGRRKRTSLMNQLDCLRSDQRTIVAGRAGGAEPRARASRGRLKIARR